MTPGRAVPYFHVAFMAETKTTKPALGRAIVTDVQFWIPVAVLAFGLLVLIWLH